MTYQPQLRTDLDDEQRDRWQRFLGARNGSHVTQFLGWGVFLRHLGYTPYHFSLENGDGWRMICLCAARSVPGTYKRFFDLGRGPVTDDPALFCEQLPYLLDVLHHAAIVRMKPFWPAESAMQIGQWLREHGWQERHDESHHTLEINLGNDLDAIQKQFKPNVRYEIRRAAKVGVEIQPASADVEFEEWFALYARMCSAKGISLPNYAFHRAQWDLWLKHQRNGALLLARHKGRIVAGSIVFCDAHRCTYFYGASVDRIPGVPFGEPLQWQAIQWAKQQGCSVYDLGGFHPQEPEGTPQYHVDRFKLGFSQNVVEYLPVHELVLDRFAYTLWKTGKRVAPRLRSFLKRLHR